MASVPIPNAPLPNSVGNRYILRYEDDPEAVHVYDSELRKEVKSFYGKDTPMVLLWLNEQMANQHNPVPLEGGE